MIRSDRTSNNEYAIIREYDHLASEYDRRWAFYINATLSKTLKRLELKASDKLLDIGCGTGSLLQVISIKHPTVNLVGLDLSIEMLKVACNKKIKKCSLIAGQALRLPSRTESFNIVISCNVFHYWREPKE